MGRAWGRGVARRALRGAGGGTEMGALAVFLRPWAQESGGFLTGLGCQGMSWAFLALIPPLAGVVAALATGAAARRTLGELT